MKGLATTSFLAGVLVYVGWEEGASNYILLCQGSGLCQLGQGGQQVHPSSLGFWSVLVGKRELASTSFLAGVLVYVGWDKEASKYILPCLGSDLCWLRRGGQQLYPSLLGFWSVLVETRGLATTSFLAGVLICDVWDTGASNYILPCWGSGLC